MRERHFVKKRAVKIAFLCITTILYTFAMGVRTQMTLDEVLVMFFIDIVFLTVFTYFLEAERLSKRLPMQETNDFKGIAATYVFGMAASFVCSYLPEYSSLAFAVSAAMALAANRETALTAGVYLNLMTVLALNQDIHVLAASIMMTLMGVMLAFAGKEKQSHLWVQFTAFFGTIIMIASCHYFQYLEAGWKILLFIAAVSAVNLLAFEIAGRMLAPKNKDQYALPYSDILKPDYPLAVSIRRFSEFDYNHALRVSKICEECARVLQLDEELCRAGGFYYRIGRMGGNASVESGVLLAQNACFPEKLIQLLREYNGELVEISTRESAVVHMVDRVVAKLDLFDKETFSTNWNQDMVIYQTLNEESATGIYDESGLSMNQFLTIRDFLVKGDQLF